MALPDWYCPNCRQMVRPTRTPGGAALAVAFAIYVGAILYAWSVDQWLNGIIFGAVAAVLIGGIIGAMTLVSSCPICKSRRVQEQPPAA